MAVCNRCERNVSLWEMQAGVCRSCRDREANEAAASAESAARAHDDITVTTETWLGREPARRLGIVTGECALGMGMFKDFATLGRDLVGGRSETFQKELREAKTTVIAEMRREAAELGADTVIGVSLTYSEISGGGRQMLFVVASGTAVQMQPTA